MTVSEDISCELNDAAFPSVVLGGLAAHDAGRLLEHLSHSLSACREHSHCGANALGNVRIQK